MCPGRCLWDRMAWSRDWEPSPWARVCKTKSLRILFVLDIKRRSLARVQGTETAWEKQSFLSPARIPALCLQMLLGCMSHGAEDGTASISNGRALSAELCSRVPGLCGGHCTPFHSLSLSLSLTHKAKFNLMRRIMYLINLIFNIQAEVFPSQHIYERCSGRNVNES